MNIYTVTNLLYIIILSFLQIRKETEQKKKTFFFANVTHNRIVQDGSGGQSFERWSCGRCTYDNHPAMDTCEICGAIRLPVLQQSARSAAPRQSTPTSSLGTVAPPTAEGVKNVAGKFSNALGGLGFTMNSREIKSNSYGRDIVFLDLDREKNLSSEILPSVSGLSNQNRRHSDVITPTIRLANNCEYHKRITPPVKRRQLNIFPPDLTVTSSADTGQFGRVCKYDFLSEYLNASGSYPNLGTNPETVHNYNQCSVGSCCDLNTVSYTSGLSHEPVSSSSSPSSLSLTSAHSSLSNCYCHPTLSSNGGVHQCHPKPVMGHRRTGSGGYAIASPRVSHKVYSLTNLRPSVCVEKTVNYNISSELDNKNFSQQSKKHIPIVSLDENVVGSPLIGANQAALSVTSSDDCSGLSSGSATSSGGGGSRSFGYDDSYLPGYDQTMCPAYDARGDTNIM